MKFEALLLFRHLLLRLFRRGSCVVPYIMGRGWRFFPDGTPPTKPRLVSSKMTSGGTLALIYQPDNN
jgi:hypothetical protein